MLHYEGTTKDFRQSSGAKVGIFSRKTKLLTNFCDYLGAVHAYVCYFAKPVCDFHLWLICKNRCWALPLQVLGVLGCPRPGRCRLDPDAPLTYRHKKRAPQLV